MLWAFLKHVTKQQDLVADLILKVSGRKSGIKDEVSGKYHFQTGELRSDKVIYPPTSAIYQLPLGICSHVTSP